MFDKCLYFNLNALTRLVNRRWIKAFKNFDLSPSHAYTLRVILFHPGITPKALTHELMIDKSTTTRFIDALEKKSLVTRKKSSGDSREQEIYPTDSAKRIRDSLEEVGGLLYQEVSSAIDDVQLVDLVKKLKRTMEELKEETSHPHT